MRSEKCVLVSECLREYRRGEFLKDKKVMRLAVGGKTKENFFEELLSDHKIRLTSQANRVMTGEGFVPNSDQPEHPINLVKVKVADLKLKKHTNATLENIYTAARDNGLDLCPAEVGPALRLVNRGQAEHNWYLIGMKPIVDEKKNEHLFYLGNDGICLTLHTDVTNKGTCYSKDIEFIFSFPQKPSK